MKRTISVFMLAVCICSLFAVTVSAAPDPLAVKFQDTLEVLDWMYDYDAYYMIKVANQQFEGQFKEDADGNEFAVVPASEYEAVLHKYFVISDAMLNTIRQYDDMLLVYNEANSTYTLYHVGGMGGVLPPREYLGYVKNGETYDVYYRHLTYEFLDDVLPEGTTVEDIIGDQWPDTVEYGGKVYQGGPEGFYTVKSRDNYGRKYTVELNGDVVRIISCVDYTEGQQPNAFDDKEVEDEVIYDIPDNSNVSIPENDCFEGNTTVKVEEITGGNTMQTVNKAMETVAEKYVAYEFTATKDNVAVQPNGKLAVTFAIPDGYSNKVAVFYMTKDGTLEKLNTTVNATERTATVELEHFSTYILADEESKPHQHSYEKVVTAPTCTAEGYTTYACACGDTYTADKVAANGHSYEKVVTAPTCTAEGYTTYTCACGDTYTADKVAADGHSYGEWKETKAPTYTEEGEEARKCVNCEHSETRTVAMLTQPDTKPSDPTEPSTEPTEPDAEPTEPSTEETQPNTTTEGTTPNDTNTDNNDLDNTGIIIAVVAVAVIALGAVSFVVIRKRK